MLDGADREARGKILVLGVGNILLRDEGVGVRIVEALAERYRFSPNVELMDGGTLGVRLLEPIGRAQFLIVVDAVRMGSEPGRLHQLPLDEIAKPIASRSSLHQLDLVESLAYAELLGNRPEGILIGIEPCDISPWSMEFSLAVQNGFEAICSLVLEAVQKAGGSFSPSRNRVPEGMVQNRATVVRSP